jgi:hypothetical protein
MGAIIILLGEVSVNEASVTSKLLRAEARSRAANMLKVRGYRSLSRCRKESRFIAGINIACC